MNEKKTWARQEARRLSEFLHTQGVYLPHKLCLQAIAAVHGSRSWQTFEASNDADIVVNDPNALTRVADAALQSVLFEALPPGETLGTLCSKIRSACEVDERENWREAKAAMNRASEGVKDRDWCVPPAELPERIDVARLALLEALNKEFALPAPQPNHVVQELYRSGMRDWRVHENTELPPTDARSYEVRLSAGFNTATVDLTYPHTSVETLPEDSPQLAAAFEINEGLPCVHLYSDVYEGEDLVSVFALRNGGLALRINAGLEKNKDALSHPLAKKLLLDENSVILSK